MMELAFCSLAELAKGLREGKFSSEELVRLYLDRIERYDGRLNAYVAVYAESARLQARAADLQRQAGLPLPALHGLPIAIKDLCDIEGQVTTAGSRDWISRRSQTTATAVRRLLDHGMIVLGKLHMSEFAFSGWGVNPAMGTPRNPWDLRDQHRVPGGSSSGSAVAVAAGLAPAALGSDTGGSIRIPAALNGITGLKPTFGRISAHGSVPLSTSMDCLGPMTRTAQDAASLLDALRGPDRLDASTVRQPWPDVGNGGSLTPAGWRIAVMDPDQYVWPATPDVRSAVVDAVAVFERAGARVQTVRLPFDLPQMYEHWSTITSAEAYAQHGAYIHDAERRFDPWVRQRILAGQAVTAERYLAAQAHRRAARLQFIDWMRDYDLILSPTVPLTACALAEVDERVTPLGTLTRWVNYVETCALSLPAGLSADGLPIGLQCVAGHWREGLLAAAGVWFQEETAWHRRTPQGLI